MDPTQTPLPNIIPHRQRHYLAVFFLSFMWGVFGVDRFYLGKIGTGLLKLVTFGGFGIWIVVDLMLIMSGTMRDKQGNTMLQYSEYRKFSRKVVLWFGVITGLIVLLSGLASLAAVYYLFTNLDAIMDGSLLNSIPGLPSIPGVPTQDAFEMYNIE